LLGLVLELMTDVSLTCHGLCDCTLWVQSGTDLPLGLKRLKPRAPDFGGPQNFVSKDNFQHFCKQLYCFFVLVQRTFFTLWR